MKFGLFISGALHALFILFAIVTLPSAFAPSELPSIIPVDLLTVDEMTNIMARQEEEPEDEPEPEAKEAEPEPEPKQVAAIEPPPEPEPEPEPVLEEEIEKVPEVEKIEEPEPEPEPEKEVADKEPPKSLPNVRPRTKPKPPPKKKDFDLDQIAALLDKTPQEEQDIHDPKEVPGEPDKVEDAPKRGVGLQTGLTISEEDALRVQMRRCWSVPAGAINPEELIVTFRIYFNEDGSLARAPELIENGPFSLRSSTFYRSAAESALRALQRCAPFTLPTGKYDVWQETEMTFDPRQMVGR